MTDESIRDWWDGVGGRTLLAASVVLGLIVGAVSVYPYEYYSGPTHILGNSAAIWLLLAFGLGVAARRPGWAVGAGALALVVTVLAFFAVVRLWTTHEATQAEVFWLAAAIVGGPVFGLAGYFWHGGSAAVQGVMAALVGGAFIAEALGFQPAPIAGPVAEATFGIFLTLALARDRRGRLVAICALPVLSAVGLGCWIAIMHVLVKLPPPA